MQRAQKHLRKVTSRMESAHEENVPTFPFRAGLVMLGRPICGQLRGFLLQKLCQSGVGQAAKKKRKVWKLGPGNMGTLSRMITGGRGRK